MMMMMMMSCRSHYYDQLTSSRCKYELKEVLSDCNSYVHFITSEFRKLNDKLKLECVVVDVVVDVVVVVVVDGDDDVMMMMMMMMM